MLVDPHMHICNQLGIYAYNIDGSTCMCNEVLVISGYSMSFEYSSAVRRHLFILILSIATRRRHNAIQSTLVTAPRGDI